MFLFPFLGGKAETYKSLSGKSHFLLYNNIKKPVSFEIESFKNYGSFLNSQLHGYLL